MTERAPEPIYFADAAEFREWLETNGASAAEVWVGFHRKRTGRESLTYPEAVDQALCFGWIDGVRRAIDEERYSNRFSPRRARSVWSAVNINRARELMEQGLMRPAGLAAFERGAVSPASYSHEQRGKVALPEELERQLRANEDAWSFFQDQPPSYRKAAIWWVVSAKKEETKLKRLATLIADSAQGRTIPPLTRRTGPR